MICADRTCFCGITSDSLTITGSGAEGDPWDIESLAFMIVTSTTRPATPTTWQHIFETDTGLQRVWDGTTWVVSGGRLPQTQLSQTVATSVLNNDTTIQANFDTEEIDDLNWHSGTNPNRVTPTVAGSCRMYATVDWQSAADYTRLMADFWKNGAPIGGAPLYRHDEPPTLIAGARTWDLVSSLVSVNGTTDYLSLRLFQTNGATAARTARCRFAVKYERS